MAGRSEDAAECGGCPAERKVMPYLLELLDGTLVDTTALVDQVCIPLSAIVTPQSLGEEGLRPVVVDLPESTWPITTTLMCIFSLLQTWLASGTRGGCGAPRGARGWRGRLTP